MSAIRRALALSLFTVGAVFAQDVRVTAPERSIQTRVLVLYPDGATLYESEWRGGNIVDVTALPYGSYVLRIFSRWKDRREADHSEHRTRITIDPVLPDDLKLTTTAHDGTTGQIINTSGDLSFRFGDYLNHRDAEAMRLFIVK